MITAERTSIPPIEEYAHIFALETAQEYPSIDKVEAECGFALDRTKLEAAAQVLACPVKAQPPNWQHGRVIYAETRRYLSRVSGPVNIIDIGTAKGFSALCLRWAADDAGVDATITSVDVIDPQARIARNTVADCLGLRTLAETLEPWPEANRIAFWQQYGTDLLAKETSRIHVAFIDGKHKYEVVKQEGRLLARRQKSGDVAMFDDAQIEGVDRAVRELQPLYALRRIAAHAHRKYWIGVRK